MAHVMVTIGGRAYRLACNEGEEPHLEGLARQIDDKIAEIRSQVGEIGDQRLVVMAALTIADDLFEARRRLNELAKSADERGDVAEGMRREVDQWAAAVAEALGDASRRIEDVAATLTGKS